MSSALLPRLWRRVHPGGNPLLRRSDRVESRVLLCFVLLCVLSLPVVGAIGSSVYAQQRALALQRQAASTLVTAVVVEDLSSMSERGELDGSVDVLASWVMPDGSVHEGKVLLMQPVRAGSTVEIWVNAEGDRVSAPLTVSYAVVEGVVVAVGSWLVLVAVLTAIFRIMVRVLDRARYAEWDRQWRQMT